jgi:hypothetical protein
MKVKYDWWQVRVGRARWEVGLLSHNTGLCKYSDDGKVSVFEKPGVAR